MRVSGGKAKGHSLKVPKDGLVRPVTSAVKVATFSMLETAKSNWFRVLDLYAGTGALGIEALSRGAEWADFVDREHRCCTIIKQNLEKTGLAVKAHVYCCSVTKALSFLESKYDIVFLDPPYANSSVIGNLLTQLANSKLVGYDSLAVVCHPSRLPLECAFDSLRLFKERRYGDTCVSIYKKGGEN